MQEIKLHVDDKNIDTVLTILKNLKDGLINEIKIDTKTIKAKKQSQYQPKTNSIIKEENSGTNDSSGKYLDVSAYKQRLKKNK